jgi:hypothetical protein
MRVTSVNPTNDASPAEIGIFLMDTGKVRTQAGILALPATTGTVELNDSDFTPDIPFLPQAIFTGVNRVTALDAFTGNSADAGVWGVAGVTRPDGVPAGEAEFSTTVASRWNQTTSDTESVSSDRFLYIQPHDGSNTGRVLVDFNQFVPGGLEVTISEAASSAFMLPYLAIQRGGREAIPEPSTLAIHAAVLALLSFPRLRRRRSCRQL